MAGLALGMETALAQRGVGRGLVLADPVDGETAEPCGQRVAFLGIDHRRGGRADPVHVGRFAGGIGRERAAPLGHDAKPAEDEGFDLGLALAVDGGDFGHAQHPGQHHPAHAEFADVEVDRVGIGGGSLHRKMAPEPRMVVGRMGQKPEVGQDHRIRPGLFGIRQRPVPDRLVPRARKGVDRHQNPGPVAMGMGHALGQFLGREVQAGKVAGVGLVGKAAIDRMGARGDGGTQRGGGSRGADQFHQKPSATRCSATP